MGARPAARSRPGTTMPATELTDEQVSDLVGLPGGLDMSGRRPHAHRRSAARAARARPSAMAALWADPPGLKGRLMAVQNDAIGKRLLFTGFFFLIARRQRRLARDAPAAGVPRERLPQPRALQRAVHDARLGDDVPRHPADHRGLRHPPAAVPARHPRDAVPAPRRLRLLHLPDRRALLLQQHAVQRRAQRRLVRLHAAQPAQLLARAGPRLLAARPQRGRGRRPSRPASRSSSPSSRCARRA